MFPSLGTPGLALNYRHNFKHGQQKSFGQTTVKTAKKSQTTNLPEIRPNLLNLTVKRPVWQPSAQTRPLTVGSLYGETPKPRRVWREKVCGISFSWADARHG